MEPSKGTISIPAPEKNRTDSCAPSTYKHLGYLLSVTAISFAVVVSRRPDALFHPQFWAEDGAIWYQQAYNMGWWSPLWIPDAGYLQTLSRVPAAFAMLFPVRDGPMIFNLVAIGVQILPVWLLNTSRFDGLIPSRWLRLVLSFLYLALPDTREIHANLSNAQWHLALAACMVILARPSRLRRWMVFDSILVLFSGLSGPFCVLLLPSAALAWLCTRTRWSLVLLVLNSIASAIQATLLISNLATARHHPPLGANPVSFSRVLGGQVFLGAILGSNSYERLFRSPWWIAGSAAPLLVATAGFFIVAYVAWKSNLALRLFILFCALNFLASMASPLVSETGDQWPIMASPGAGGRYYFLPMLAWVVCLLWLAAAKNQHRILRGLGIGVLAFMLIIGIRKDWRFPPFIDDHFVTYSKQFKNAPQGTPFNFPINPNWVMVLNKR